MFTVGQARAETEGEVSDFLDAILSY